jgi:hypothetical protein
VFFLSRAFWLICRSEFQAIAHGDAHNVFMALPPYTSTREDEARHLGVAPNHAKEDLAVRQPRLSPGPICALMAVQLPVYKEGIRKPREQREKQGLKRRQLS